MGRILFLTNMERQQLMLEKARESVAQAGLQAETRTVLLSDAVPWGEEWQKTFAACNIVIFTWMGSGLDTAFLRKSAEFLRKRQLTHVMLISDPDAGELSCGVSPAAKETLQQYLAFGGMENFRQFWRWLAQTYCREDTPVRNPEPLLWQGIYHPRAPRPFTDLTEYRAAFCRPDRPTIGLLFYRDEWVWGDLAYQAALIEEIEGQGMNALAVFCQYVGNPELQAPGLKETLASFFCPDGQAEIDVILNTFKFSMLSMKAIAQEALNQLGVPILQAYTLYRPRQEWQESSEGMTAMEMAVSIAMPEFDGAIHGVPVAGREYQADGNAVCLPLAERITMMVRKAGKWAGLRRKPNAAKKIGIIFHNYPPTNSNIGSAAGLDSPESIRLLLASMRGAGYKIDRIPADSQSFMNELIAHATNDRRYLTERQIEEADGQLTAAQYQTWFEAAEPGTQEQLIKDWGHPPGDVFHYDGKLLVPGMLNGNIYITVQPPRGFGEDPAKLYHSPDCAPTHHYLGYYYWLRDVWQADAVVHVGTHGSLEWLPGKGAGLSRECYPDLAIDDLPNIYPYWITVVGEGVQAKRRGAACLISYLTPPMSHAGTYDELAELENLLDEYCHFRQTQPDKLATVTELIRAKAAAANLGEDVPEDPAQPFDDFVGRLHVYVTDIKNMQIRTGLHTLGRPPAGDTLIEYLLALTRVDNGDVPSLAQTLAAAYGCDYYQLLEQSGQLLPDGTKTGGALLDDIRERCRDILSLLAEREFEPDQAAAILTFPWAATLPAGLKERLLTAAVYVCRTIAPSLAKTTQEITNLLAALAGRYVEPGPGGAPTSGGADILPTGRNFYGVDPRTLPTPAAWEIGRTMGDDVIASYIAEEGRYPENIGIVLWATSNMRSHGQCIAQFLYLLGVKPVWQKGSMRVVELEVIPAAELKRPRIDVTGRISGLFRDSMPMAAAWLDKAVALVSRLEESPDINYVRKHITADAKAMEEEGLDSATAWEQASWRIFGDPPGTYGAGVGAVLEAKNWETIDDLAKVYVRWGGHAYSGKGQGAYVPELFSRRMGSLDITIQNQDNREISMLNSDDYNAYHGGMIAAVRSIKGEAPRSYCGDSSDRKKVIMRSLQAELKRLFRGEAINPKFIEGMQEHGYKGAADLSNYVAHSYQWDATSDVMEDWMYEKYAEKYALDAAMQAWMKEVNPWALRRIAETLLEAAQRGLWDAREDTKRELEQLYLAIEGELEERSDA
ncbi:MAG TPA: cobaltochelatase subunit CobN [Methylomusa anaerophila]|uniref:Aerobic cobaltochelatase subunit CobN n=1 Tax=Methylomusa anaerophila TaxID=1930071 RepID=A0A348AL83_9FIRM|nr:cobaltochelatase subunit CobN [Methylomusa anaerophila]BBB91831.1 aerobic cobaltochelatase subunit CobN [Methylomusa anaerophila]HML88436.1 cobaltochelatase subunit CobN [Methylomusa anaerophila]